MRQPRHITDPGAPMRRTSPRPAPTPGPALFAQRPAARSRLAGAGQGAEAACVPSNLHPTS